MFKVMVTGGSGYIGSHIVRELADNDYSVVSLDKAMPLDFRHKNISEFTLDLKNYSKLDSFFKNNPDIKCVIHCAGELGIKRSFIEKELFYSENIYATECLLNAMIQNNVHNFIFSSSAAVYPISKIPLAEDVILEPEEMSPYALSKYFCEEKLKLISAQMGINFIAFRYFNIIGCDLYSTKAIERYLKIDNILPNLINKSLRKQAITINGNNYDTVDGTCVRDYLDVRELARLHLRALECITSNEWSRELNGVYNAGSGHATSVSQLIDLFNMATGESIIPCYGERRNGDASFLCANIDKTKKVFSWDPVINNVEMISSLWKAKFALLPDLQ